METYTKEFNDMFGRKLSLGDKCLRVTSNSIMLKPKIEIVTVQEFTTYKIKIGNRRFVDSHNIILLSERDLDKNESNR